jgi:hypothetical protein
MRAKENLDFSFFRYWTRYKWASQIFYLHILPVLLCILVSVHHCHKLGCLFYRRVKIYLVLQNASAGILKHILIWVEEQTYWIAHRFLVLGFELELYSPSEYCMVYWYLYVVLIRLAEKTHLKMTVSDGSGRRTSTSHLFCFQG